MALKGSLMAHCKFIFSVFSVINFVIFAYSPDRSVGMVKLKNNIT